MSIHIFSLTKNDLVFKGIKPYFEVEGIFFSGISTNPQNATSELLQCNPLPSIVLLSANWPFSVFDVSGISLMNKFRLLLPLPQPPKIILVTNVYEPETIKRFEEHKPDGYLYQNAGLGAMIECIKKVHEGETVFLSPQRVSEITKY